MIIAAKGVAKTLGYFVDTTSARIDLPTHWKVFVYGAHFLYGIGIGMKTTMLSKGAGCLQLYTL